MPGCMPPILSQAQVHALQSCSLQIHKGLSMQCLLNITRGWFCVQAGLNKTHLNVLSSCEETDAMEDHLSSQRSGGRKKKVLSLPVLCCKD